MPTIIVVGAVDEDHTKAIAAEVVHRGAGVHVIDTQRFPSAERLSWTEDGLIHNGQLLQATAVCLRAVFISIATGDLDCRPDNDGWYSHYVDQQKKHSFMGSILRNLQLRGVKVVNPQPTFDMHFLKLFQIALLQSRGVRLPRTLATNDPTALRQFVARENQVICKPMAGGALASMLTPDDLSDERLATLTRAPVLFQEYIPGDNVRMYLLHDRLLSAAVIETDEVDYRQAVKGTREVHPPSDVIEASLRAMEACGMVFSGVDWKCTPQGEWVLLECNPTPLFLGFEERVGRPILAPLVDYLVSQHVSSG